MASRDKQAKQPNLAWLIIKDWLEHKLVIFLVLCVMSSAYAVVYFAWKNRQLNTEVQKLQDKQDRLGVDWRHMLLELNALSEHSRVEQIATKQLEMKRPDRAEERIIELE
ncbi:cell division protein FtsL [Saccharobesus litoralis]|uniref:Cell division protein FtsL n=1 Tax=Saccharobesus litoralis TaxID=2172099 RepID=A0A2S0VX00_9ALTE|nr:cell division protein FtsL [Saccharobesus litoralis]AWB68747.1 cell division protein FtsL [Saccharobesus litoralis]